MAFTEKVHAYIAAKFYVYLNQEFGERGDAAFLHGTQYYAMQRGRRMAQRAIRDGKPLTQETYNFYGEWVNTEEVKALGCANQSVQAADGTLHITQCPWYTQFKEMGLSKAGALYCKDLDSSISCGFNPFLQYQVDQTLHTADCCIHKILTGDICAGAGKGKNPAGLRSSDKVVMKGTVRTHSSKVRQQAEKWIRNVVENVARANDAQAALEYQYFPGVLVNDDRLAEIARNSVKKLYGTEALGEHPLIMGSEDFSYFLEKIPGVYALIGCRNEKQGKIYQNHHPKFDVDEAILKRGAALYAQFAIDYLEKRENK